MDSQQPGEVRCLSRPAQSSCWGELLAAGSRRPGAAKIGADAYTRHTTTLMEMGYPTCVTCINAQRARFWRFADG